MIVIIRQHSFLVLSMPEEWKFDDSIDTFVAYKRYIASKPWALRLTIFAYLIVNLSGYEMQFIFHNLNFLNEINKRSLLRRFSDAMNHTKTRW